jgi:hypothetical protein
MKSKVLKSDQQSLLELSRAMTPQMRLEAFYQHSQSLSKISEAGKTYRRKASFRKHRKK